MNSKKLYAGLLIAFLLLLSTLNFLPQTQTVTQKYLDDAFDRAFISFAIAKSLNAVISVAQGTQIAATPAGLGAVFTPGELLDPFNDMVERFSWVMLASTVSLGIQKILMLLFSSLLLQYLLAFFGLMTIAGLLLKRYGLLREGMRLFILLALLRFAIPALAFANDMLYSSLLAPTYTDATSQLQSTRETTEALIEQKEEATSWFGKMKEMFDDTVDALNVKKQLESLKEDLDASFRHILTLITLFIIQTILSPLLFLYLLIQLIKTVLKQSLESQYLGKALEHLFTQATTKAQHESKP